MDVVIPSPTGSLNLHVCKDGDGDGDGWVTIYERSFPEDQRQDLSEIRRQIAVGTMELDETRAEDERVVCMTLTEVFAGEGPRFLLGCYTATDPGLRSLGIGSVHRRRLADLLRGEYPEFLGLISEIESTREPGLDPQTLLTRRRRLAFFERLGLERLPVDYRFPSYQRGQTPLRGELLWTPFASHAPDGATLRRILVRIYIEGYGLDPDDPFIPEAIAIADGPPT